MTKAEENKNNLAEAIEEFTKDAREFIESTDIYEVICKKLVDAYSSSTDTSNALNIIGMVSRNISRFIIFVLEADESVLNEFLEKSNLTEEEAKIVSSFRKRYRKILRNVIMSIRSEAMGFKDVITGVDLRAYKFNQRTNEPVVELDLLSFDRLILHTEMPTGDLYAFAHSLMNVVRNHLKILSSNKLEVGEDFIERMKKISKDIREILTEISNLLEKMSKETDIDDRYR